MPALVRLYIHHVAIGFALGLCFTGLLMWLNVGNLWHLVRATEEGWIAAIMLVVFNGIVFAGVQFAIVIMRMGEDERPGGGRPAREPVAEVPLAATVKAR